MRLHSRHRAFTLVELLVVIAIIGILIALLVPAVQMVRETARRSSCSNKQKNIAAALQAYNSSKEHFPRMASGTYDPATGFVNEPVWSWTVFVLPFLEGENISNQLSPNSQSATDALTDSTTYAIMCNKLAIFRCGSDNGEDLNTSRQLLIAGKTYTIATSNYVGSNAAGALELNQYGGSPPPLASEYGCTFGTASTSGTVQGLGLFNCMRKFRSIEEIDDGQSNTIAIGERTWEYGPRNAKQYSRAANLFVGRPFSGFGYLPGQGAGDVGGTAGYGVNGAFPSDTDGQDAYSAAHPAGANFAFVDGSTHFIWREVDVLTLQRLSAVNDQLIIGEY